MAESLLFAVAELTIETLGSAALKEIGLIWGVNDEFEKLNTTLRTIKSVLRDAEKKSSHNYQIKDWLERLEDVVGEADDLLDQVATEGLLRRLRPQKNKIAKKVRSFFSSSNPCVVRLNMAHKIRHIREKLDDLAADREKFHLEISHEETKTMGRVRETHSFVLEDDVVGRVEDKEKVLQLLLNRETNDTCQENVSVLPIVGMGGLGKTTLAQLVFNDEKVKAHFDLKIWVCVSDNFDEKILIENIVQSITDKSAKDDRMEKLQKTLLENIKEKRYLLVLDDVWNENHQEWRGLKGMLNHCREGSRIILTTRSEIVAKIIGTLKPYFLGILDPSESWSLFSKIAFGQGEEPTDPVSLSVAEEIVRKCGGVPLAITSIGGLLYSRGQEIDWRSFLERELSEIIPEENNHVLKTLRLSYEHLPSHLKCCFVFCRLFPKDYEIDVHALITMWIAQGLIKSSNQNQRDLEDIGHDYFMELYWRSFFQEVEIDEVNGVKTCKMHDLVHDLAVEVAGSKYETLASNKESISARVRHLSMLNFDLGSSKNVPSSLLPGKGLRSILVESWGYDSYYTELPQTICNDIISNFKLLRILNIANLVFATLPKSIGELKFLRYLDLSGNLLRTLPSSITKLVNLQTLKLNNNDDLQELPREIEKLVNLRHLEFYNSDAISHFPRGLSQLTNLQTLPKLVMKNDRQSATIDVLKGLNKLRGKLEIKGLRGEMETEGANLKGKEKLHSLSLEWFGDDGDDDDDDDDDDVVVSTGQQWKKTLDGLRPHPNLKKLKIRMFNGPDLSTWISSLTNLVVLELKSCEKCQILASLDELVSLKEMKLVELSALEYIDTSGDGDSRNFMKKFPSLLKLTLLGLPELRGWCFGIRGHQELFFSYFPRLTELTVSGCPKLISMPMYPNINGKLRLYDTRLKPFEQTVSMFVDPQISSQELEIDRCNNLQILNRDGIRRGSFTSLHTLILHHLLKLQYLFSGLKYLTSLELLAIQGCEELETLSNSNDPIAWENLINLRELFLHGLPKLRHLCPGIRNLTSLECLGIKYCDELELTSYDAIDPIKWENLKTLELISLPKLRYLFSGLKYLTSLEHLKIEGCKEFETLSDSNDPILWENLTSLHELFLFGLPKLRYLCRGIRNLSSLERLRIKDCDELELTSYDAIGPIKWENLTTLKLIRLPKLRYLFSGLKYLTSLEHLEIEGCKEFETFSDSNDPIVWENLTSLREVVLDELPKLRHLCRGICNLSSLERLRIKDCDELELTSYDAIDPIKWENLTTLHLIELPKLVKLPEGLQRSTNLQMLNVRYCFNLKEIPDWISELCSLQYLMFNECTEMESLPGSINRLTSLQQLHITSCGILSERCQREKGEYWPRIQHIPDVLLDS